MDEREWLTSTDPHAMFTFLRNSGKLSERKARLFSAAVCRRIWHLLTDQRSREAIEVAERYVDGEATAEQLEAAWEAAVEVEVALLERQDPGQVALYYAASAASGTARPEEHAEGDALDAIEAAGTENEPQAQAGLVRDIVGNPFRATPSLALSLLGTAVQLAQAAFEERELPSGHLDPVRLAVLADALEEGGADAELVGHLREPGPHVRGCWVVDLITGRQ